MLRGVLLCLLIGGAFALPKPEQQYDNGMQSFISLFLCLFQ
jgi:hypothetical protein